MTAFPYETRASLGEIRADDDQAGTYAGHFSYFWSVDDHATAFEPKAFRKTLGDRRGRLAMAWFHDPTQVIGPIVEAKEDKVGAFYRAKPVGVLGQMVLDNLRAGAEAGVSHFGNSFGFWRIKDRTAEDDDPIDLSTGPAGIKRGDVRVISEVRVDEITTLPWTFASQPKAAIDDVRGRVFFDAAPIGGRFHDLPLGILTSTLAEIRDGTLSEERAAVVEELVAAWGARAGAGGDAPDHSTPVEARHETPDPHPVGPDFALLAAAALSRSRLVLSGVSA